MDASEEPAHVPEAAVPGGLSYFQASLLSPPDHLLIQPLSGIGNSKRSSQTCATCRVRKVRCDSRRPVCSNCARLGFPCSYSGDDASSSNNSNSNGYGTTFDVYPAHAERPSLMAEATAAAAMATATSMEATGHGSEDSRPATLIPRRRARRACLSCHARKARCSGSTPNCDRCRALGIECVYRQGKRSSRSSQPVRSRWSAPGSVTGGDETGGGPEATTAALAAGQPSLAPLASPVPPSLSLDILESMAMKTFEQFFSHIHHVPTCAFLHRASLMQRFHAGLVDRSLLYALVGLTSLMTDLGPGTRELGTRCIAQAESLVLAHVERPSTLALQTLVFITHHRILAGHYASAFMLLGLASRFAVALRLHRETPRLCFLARESRRRLMWALYMMDVDMASGRDDVSLWMAKTHTIDLQLPCNERNFEFDLPEKCERLQPLQPPHPPHPPSVSMATADSVLPSPSLHLSSPPSPPIPDNTGFLALHIRVIYLRGRILQFLQSTRQGCGSSNNNNSDNSDNSVSVASSLPARTAELAQELDAFAARLPASFRWSESNVRLRTYSPRLCVFIMTHLWWEQCQCELYSVALPPLHDDDGYEENRAISSCLPSSSTSPASASAPAAASMADAATPTPATAAHNYQRQLDILCADFVRRCRSEAYKHTMALADMFRLLLTLDSGIPVTALDLPSCLYQCARLLHFFSRDRAAHPELYLSDPDLAAPPEALLECIRVCLQVLERCIHTPATLRIHENMERLLDANSTSGSRQGTPERTDVGMDAAVASEPFPLPYHAAAAAAAAVTVTGEAEAAKGKAAMAAAAMETGTGMAAMSSGTLASAATGPFPSAAPPSVLNEGSVSALDAFDLDTDVNVLGNVNFANWFSSDWPATNNFPDL